MSLLAQLKDEMKTAMRTKQKVRLGVIRMALSAIKQVEIDSQKTLDDAGIIAVLTKMVKQRNDSIKMYLDGGRDELAAQETEEVSVLQEFLPAPLSAAEIDELIAQAIAEVGASSMADMGKVMGLLKPKLQGRADFGKVSALIKNALSA